jgi:transposase
MSLSISDVAGIDISKDSFDVVFQQRHTRYAYSLSGMEQLLSDLSATPHAALVMEATGTYFYKLALFLVEAGRQTFVVNPCRIHRYAQLCLQRHKTDKADAKLIRDFAVANHDKITAWTPEPDSIAALRQLRTVRAQLEKTATVYHNQLHALVQLPKAKQSKTALSICKRMIAEAEKQIKAIYSQMDELLDDELKKNYALLDSIQGIGKESAMTLLILTNNFTKFQSAKAFADYIGIAPTHRQSGASVQGKGAISKIGDSRARQVLYMAAMSAKTYNPACREFYIRLRQKGHAHKQAIIAVANKLIRQAFAVIRQQLPFQPKLSQSFLT